jgi:hypothetical protein
MGEVLSSMPDGYEGGVARVVNTRRTNVEVVWVVRCDGGVRRAFFMMIQLYIQSFFETWHLPFTHHDVLSNLLRPDETVFSSHADADQTTLRCVVIEIPWTPLRQFSLRI